MKKHRVMRSALVVILSAILLALIGCAKKDKGKIPITTTAESAREYYLQGRDLFERLQVQESRQFFEKAVAEDPSFAMGYLFLSFAQPTNKGFFENLDKAVALVDNASEGERLWILGAEAGTNAFAMKQRELYQKLVELYPNDERAHNLLGTNYFGQQEYALAIEPYKKATEIAPDFSPPYNQLGYAYRFLENYADAEKAFQKYIELIPDDPNPYDSYAELLLKMGRYDESIENYRNALEYNPNFVASHIGIATNLNYKGQHEEARKQLQKLYDIARNDGERRAAHFAMTVSYVDQGNMDKALKEQEKQYALAEKIKDATAMAGDLVTMGDILREMGKYDQALEKYEKALEIVEASDRTEEVKDNFRRGFLYNSAHIALKKGDFGTAKAKAEEFRKRVEAIDNPFQIRLAHQLMGMIALEEKEYDKALSELQQANQQNPYNFYRMALAYRGKGDQEKAKELFLKAANFNQLNSLAQAYIRTKAQQLANSM